MVGGIIILNTIPPNETSVYTFDNDERVFPDRLLIFAAVVVIHGSKSVVIISIMFAILILAVTVVGENFD
jgi:hypothetical protein